MNYMIRILRIPNCRKLYNYIIKLLVLIEIRTNKILDKQVFSKILWNNFYLMDQVFRFTIPFWIPWDKLNRKFYFNFFSISGDLGDLF